VPNINGGVLDGVRRIGARVRELVIDGGVPGAPLGFRMRGATQAGPPLTGTWKAGDQVPDRSGVIWICTAGGTGAAATWVSSAGVPASSTQGGTAGSPALTQQWQFQAANTTNAAGSGAFGSVFWPGTFGSVTETSWDFGYNSPKLSGFSAAKPQAYFSILPDCGDTHGVEIELNFTSPDGSTCFPFQFVGQTNGTKTGQWLFSLPPGDGTIQFAVHNADNSVTNYLSMTGVAAATASSPGSVTFGSAANPLTLSVTGAELLYQRLSMLGTTGVANSLNLTIGGASAPASVNAQIYLEPASGQTALIGFGQAGTDSWRLQVPGSTTLAIYDVANGRSAMSFNPGSTSTSSVTVNGPFRCFYGFAAWNTAPPSSQPTAASVTLGYTAGSSTAVTIDGKFTGNTGATAYTIADIVNALKKTGLIAA